MSIIIVFKYADDTNLLIPEHIDVQLCDEYDSDGVKARAPKAKTKAKAIGIKTKAKPRP